MKEINTKYIMIGVCIFAVGYKVGTMVGFSKCCMWGVSELNKLCSNNVKVDQ